MSYAFPPDIADVVQQVLSTGNYRSEDEVLRAALNTQLERDEMQEGIRGGIEDLENERVTPLEDVDAAMRAKYSIPHLNGTSESVLPTIRPYTTCRGNGAN